MKDEIYRNLCRAYASWDYSACDPILDWCLENGRDLEASLLRQFPNEPKGWGRQIAEKVAWNLREPDGGGVVGLLIGLGIPNVQGPVSMKDAVEKVIEAFDSPRYYPFPWCVRIMMAGNSITDVLSAYFLPPVDAEVLFREDGMFMRETLSHEGKLVRLD